ncbi:MAG: hypothetical protein HY700_18850 [Gemmatimonadetes bacterium]|nr:hypothetical protein [Gemmatimonadota bacterium]
MIRSFLCPLALGCLCVAAQAQAPAAAAAPQGLKPWHTGADGVARMYLAGDTASPTGLVALRVRFPAKGANDSAGARVHAHLASAHITVLKGTMVVGFGDQVDYGKVTEYGPGSFIVIPSGEPHYEWYRGEVEIHLEAVGPLKRVELDRGKPHIAAAGRPTSTPGTPAADAAANGLKEWKTLPNGGQMMRLAGGDPPNTTELVAFRIRYPLSVMRDSTRIYHFHYGTEHVLILRGSLIVGTGNRVDYSQAVEYGPGSFIEIPAGTPHFEWSRGDLEAQIETIGSLRAVDLDPKTGEPR